MYDPESRCYKDVTIVHIDAIVGILHSGGV